MIQNRPQQHDDTPEPEGEQASPDRAGPENPDAAQAAEAEKAAKADMAAAETTADKEVDLLEAVKAELAETKDRMLRAMAETENLRRRAARDTDEARKYAITGFARELLEVSDNLARALESVPDEARDNEQVKPLVEGIELTQRTLAACFERQKIVKVAPEPGDKFDHNLHQAMFETETDELEPGSVVQVMQAGYQIADRLLRPAMVGVAKKPAAPKPVDQEPANDARGQHLDTSA